MLKACLASEANFEDAFRAWESTEPWQGVDAGIHRLLPYLYRRVQRYGLATELRLRLKGVYVRYWHDALRAERGPLQDVLEMGRAGFEPILLKGAGLQLTIYGGDRPTRPTTDVDILVPQDRVREAVAWLIQRGYATLSNFAEKDRFAWSKSIGLTRAGLELDINWRIHPFGLDPEMEGRFIRRRVVVMTDASEFGTLAPQDHLLHALLHGSEANAVPTVRWILDACLLARELSESDWAVFVAEVESGGYQRPVAPMLRYLHDFWGAPVPSWTVARLESGDSSTYAFIADWYLGLPPGRMRQLARVSFAHYLTERHLTEGHPWRHFALRAPRVSWGATREYMRRRRG